MKTGPRFAGLLAGLLLAANACAEQWFTVVSAGTNTTGATVEVDLDTLRLMDQGGEGVIRITHEVLQPHPGGYGYRSVVATAHFDCTKRAITLASAAYYPLPAGKGPRVGADSAGQQAGLPPSILQGMPEAARRALLKATCGTG